MTSAHQTATMILAHGRASDANGKNKGEMEGWIVARMTGKLKGKKVVRLEGGGQAAHTSGETLRMRSASGSLPNI